MNADLRDQLRRERARLAAQGRRVSLDELVAMLLLHWQAYPPAELPTRQEAIFDAWCGDGVAAIRGAAAGLSVGHAPASSFCAGGRPLGKAAPLRGS